MVPPGTINDAGAVSIALLLVSETVVPPDAAFLDNVTVHVLEPLAFSAVGLQLRVETVMGATKLMLAGCETPFSVAVIVAFPSPATVDVVALNVPEAAPAAIVVEAGTASAVVLVLPRVTRAPPAGAA